MPAESQVKRLAISAGRLSPPLVERADRKSKSRAADRVEKGRRNRKICICDQSKQVCADTKTDDDRQDFAWIAMWTPLLT
jgi:hypothetical protein